MKMEMKMKMKMKMEMEMTPLSPHEENRKCKLIDWSIDCLID